MAQSARGGRSSLHYAWIVVGITFLALLVSAGARSTPSVLIVPLEQEFGWSRATISFAIALQLMFYGIIGPFSAGFIDRIGVRKMMLAALVLMLTGLALTPFVTQSWQLLLFWGVFIGLGTGTVAMVMAAIVANRWFVARRGMVMGLLSGSTAAGQLLFLPLLANLVVHFGWRMAVVAGCVVVALVIPLAALLMRDQPGDIGALPYGHPADAPPPNPPRPVGNPFSAAFAALGKGAASRDFWLLSGSFFVCGGSTVGLIGTHFIPACLDHGIPEATAAGILAGMGVCNFIGTTASGWLSDRFDNRYLLCWYFGLRGLSLVFLPYAFGTVDSWALSLFGLFYGLDWLATVPPTVRLTTNIFGARDTGMMYGWLMVMHQVGSAMAAYGTGLFRTVSGGYSGAFLLSGSLCFVAALIVLGIGRAPSNRPRPALASAEA